MTDPPPNLVDLNRRRFINDLYGAHWAELCRWLRRRFGAGPPEPEDVAQTAFRKLAEIEDLSFIRDPKAFLFTVAARDAVSQFRRLVTNRAYIDRELRDHGLEVEEITPERVYLHKERLQAVEKGLAGLTDMQREIIMRSRLQGQTYAEISAETGWSMASISRHLQSALIAVGRTLAASGEGEDER